MDVSGRRILLMGLGRHGGGVAAARFLAESGAKLTITDSAPPEALAESIAALADVPIADWALGGHRESDFDNAEIVVVNPAVRLGNPLVERAATRSAKITSELELFLERCPARVVGVTGSNGKSTTTAMIAAILRADGQPTFLGGNIGNSLLPDLGQITAASVVVVEISSFQLAWLSPSCPLPTVAVLINFSPNHLDWHRTLGDYAMAKARLFAGEPHDVAVIGPPCAAAGSMTGCNAPTASSPVISATVRRRIAPVPLESIPPLRVPGEHNRANAACAAAVAEALGCSPVAIAVGLREYSGLPHRLEPLGTVAGRTFYNDSMSTTPESAIAALETFSGRCWLLAGGYDKGADFAQWAAAVARHARGAACYGAVGPRLHALVQHAAASTDSAGLFDTLDAAFAWCWRCSDAGDAIVLSPACASYDQFVDYRARGERFRDFVRKLGEMHGGDTSASIEKVRALHDTLRAH